MKKSNPSHLIYLAPILWMYACAEEATSVTVHPGGTISGGEVWAEGIHVVEGDITVNAGALTIEACSTVKMEPDVRMTISDGGSLVLAGRADCPITVTSNKATPSPGDWAYIEIFDTADAGNLFEYATIEYAGQSYGSVWLDEGATLSMNHTTVRHSATFGVEVGGAAVLAGFAANTLVDNALGPITLGANVVGQLQAGTYGPNDVDGIAVRFGRVDRDATWRDLGVPYIAQDGFAMLTETGSAALTLAPGVVLKLGDAAVIDVNNHGGFAALGSATAPVTITSAKSSPMPGDWPYIEFFAGSVDANNRFEHAVIEYGGQDYGSIWIADGASVAITNTTVRYSNHYGIEVEGTGDLREFHDNTVVDNARAPVALCANRVDRLQAGVYGPNDVDGIQVEFDYVDHDSTWRALGVPFVAENGFAISVDSGSANLTVEAGARLEIGPDALIAVADRGSLNLAGTDTEHVVVTSSKDPAAAGDWGEIDIYATSNGNNSFSYTDIEYGGAAGYGQLWVEAGASLALDHVTFNNADCDVSGEGAVDVVATASTYSFCM